MSFIDNVVLDFKLNSFISFVSIFIYRVENVIWNSRLKLFCRLSSKFFALIKLVMGINNQISYKAKIGKGLRLPHKGFGVVISSFALIGDNVTIYHLVTIGINENKKDEKRNIFISSGCYLSVGSKVISCRLGKNVRLAPNAVVYYDCDDDVLIKR